MRCMAQHGMRCMAHSMTCMEHVCCIHQSWPKKLIIVYDIFFGKRNFRTFAAQPRQWNTYYKKTRHKQTWPCASNCPARAWIVKQHVYVHECMHAWKRDCIWSQLCLKNRHPKKNGKKKNLSRAVGGNGTWSAGTSCSGLSDLPGNALSEWKGSYRPTNVVANTP